jgi:hypothetical protein
MKYEKEMVPTPKTSQNNLFKLFGRAKKAGGSQFRS